MRFTPIVLLFCLRSFIIHGSNTASRMLVLAVNRMSICETPDQRPAAVICIDLGGDITAGPSGGTK
jgi:hypothetical protein